MQIKKVLRKTLIFTLTLILAVQSSILPISAVEKEETGSLEPDSEQLTYENIQTEDTVSPIIDEETALRDAYTKHFRMQDGTMQAVQYRIPVHFYDGESWIEYDNTIKEYESEDKADTEQTDATIESNAIYDSLQTLLNLNTSKNELGNTLADYSVRFSKKSNGNKLVRLEKDGYDISWTYQSAEKVNAQTENHTDDGDPLTVENVQSKVVYADIFNDTDLEYILQASTVKENIILKSAQAPAVFTAHYKAVGLTPVAVDDKTVQLCDSDNAVVFSISAPCVIDANGVFSDALTLTLGDVKNNSFSVTTAIDPQWLEQADRAYPITVDPVLQTKQTWNADSQAHSAFVASNYPNKSYGYGGNTYEGSLYVGYEVDYGKVRSLVKTPNLPTLSVADKVVHAELCLYTNACWPEVRVDVHRATSAWNQSTVTWNTQCTYDSQIEDYQIVQSMSNDDSSADRWQRFEITELVRGWYSGEYANHGVVLTSESENSTSGAYAWFFSSGYTSYHECRPFMIIAYRNMSGYENYWSYTNLSAGRNGVLSVNNYNGNLVFSQPVTNDNGGNIMPVGISLTYNSNRTSAYMNTDLNFTAFGVNMQSNFHTSLYRETSNTSLTENGFRYCMTDADGTKHWFYSESADAQTAKDEDGLGYTLDRYPPENTDWYKVEDKDGNKMFFDGNRKLIRMDDTNGNSINIAYTAVNGKQCISTVTDGAGRVYAFTYDANGQCTCITDPAGVKTAFSYTGSGSSALLSGITFQSGTDQAKTVSLIYSSQSLTCVTAIDGTRAKITYTSDNQKRVQSVNWGASDSQVLESYTFSYKQNETTVTDHQGRDYTYQFNDFGQTTGIISQTDQTACFYDRHPGNSTDARANKLLSESKVIKSVSNLVKNPGCTDGISGYTRFPSSNSESATIEADSSTACLTKGSLKLTKTSAYTNNVYAQQVFSGLSGVYTASAYINTKGQTLTGKGILFAAELWNGSTYVKTISCETITKTDTWERISFSFEVPQGYRVHLDFGIRVNSTGTVWYDDVQLEKGAGTSSCNLIENTDLYNGTTGWSGQAGTIAVTTLSGYEKCLYLTGNASNSNQGILQTVQTVAGAKGDVFSFGTWVKAFSVPVNDIRENDSCKPEFSVILHFYNASGTSVGTQETDVNCDVSTWQFVAAKAIAPAAYSYVKIEINYDHNVNTLYAVGAFVYKEEFGQTYVYNNEGTVVSAKDYASSESSFAFNSNQMSALVNPSGSAYYYSHDEDTNNLLTAFSTNGQRYDFTYDSYGNATSAGVYAQKAATAIMVGQKYIILNAESGNCLDASDYDYIRNCRYTANKNDQIWQVVSTNESGVYTLLASNTGAWNLKVSGGENTENRPMVPQSGTTDAYRFKIQSATAVPGTFNILTKTSNYARCVDGQPQNSTDYDDGLIVRQTTLNADDRSQCWYFYPVTSSTGKKIQTSATYTTNGNFASSVTDQTGNTSDYTYNTASGTLTRMVTPKQRFNYTYNADNSLSTVTSNGTTVAYTYTNDRLTTVNADEEVWYQFAYDAYGRASNVQVGYDLEPYRAYTTLATYAYNGAGLLSALTYGNNWTVNYTYDNLDRVTQIRYNNSSTQKLEYLYGSDGNVAQVIDYAAGTRTKPTYDLSGRLVSVKEYSGTALTNNTVRSQHTYTYADKTNYLVKKQSILPTGTLNTTYTYGDAALGQMPDQIYKIVNKEGWAELLYTYDTLGRVTSEEIDVSVNPSLVSTYTYKDVDSARTTSLVSTHTNKLGTYAYTYDSVGNITSFTFTPTGSGQSKSVYYTYNSSNQLTREDNQFANKTYLYFVTSTGNFTGTQEAPYTAPGTTPSNRQTVTDMAYDDWVWSDRVTEINGDAVTYDAIGNPTAIGDVSLTWQGRNMTQYADDTNVYNYAYDMSGRRTTKSINGTQTKFYYEGNTLAAQQTGSDKLTFMFDAKGAAYGFFYNGTPYFYIRNLQSDIVGITDSAGTVLGTYVYDAWGNLIESASNISNSIAQLNPLRYRGYYYDTETGYYFLNSRYYNPKTGRFLNADAILDQSTLTGNNMFAYCNNNPVNMADPNGNLPFLVITAAICAVGGAIIGGIAAAKSGGNIWAGIGIGAAAGGLAGAGLGAAAGVMLAGSAVASTAAVASGAGMLVTAVSTGGIGTGLALVADNISRSANNVGTVLYSGGERASQVATTFANNTGGATMNSTVIGKVADAAANVPGADFTAVWSKASATFCHQASGVVNAFVSNSSYHGVDSIFWSVEMPTLLNNPRVTEIIIHIFE